MTKNRDLERVLAELPAGRRAKVQMRATMLIERENKKRQVRPKKDSRKKAKS
jgi:hypothetical protein